MYIRLSDNCILFVIFHCNRSVREKHDDVVEWLSTVRKNCPKKLTKRRTGINIGLQKMIYSGIEAFLLDEEEERGANEDGDESSSENEEAERNGSSVIIPNHVCLPALMDLISVPDLLKIDFGEERDRLNEL